MEEMLLQNAALLPGWSNCRWSGAAAGNRLSTVRSSSWGNDGRRPVFCLPVGIQACTRIAASRVRVRSSSSGDAQTDQEDPEKKAAALAEKLAAAEAEAEALRRELAMRKGIPASTGFKIDGIGYRETILTGPQTAGKLARREGGGRSWGFTEAELLQATQGDSGDGGSGGGNGAAGGAGGTAGVQLVQRRLLIGAGLSAAVLALSFVEIPVTVTPPAKPLNIYLVPILRLQSALGLVQEQGEFLDALGLRAQLKLAVGSLSSVRENLLSATALLDASIQPEAQALAFRVIDYLEQADYSKYFEGMGAPGPSQEAEYIKFSLQSLQVSREKLGAFLALMPESSLRSAREQLEGGNREEENAGGRPGELPAADVEGLAAEVGEAEMQPTEIEREGPSAAGEEGLLQADGASASGEELLEEVVQRTGGLEGESASSA